MQRLGCLGHARPRVQRRRDRPGEQADGQVGGDVVAQASRPLPPHDALAQRPQHGSDLLPCPVVDRPQLTHRAIPIADGAERFDDVGGDLRGDLRLGTQGALQRVARLREGPAVQIGQQLLP